MVFIFQAEDMIIQEICHQCYAKSNRDEVTELKECISKKWTMCQADITSKQQKSKSRVKKIAESPTSMEHNIFVLSRYPRQGQILS